MKPVIVFIHVACDSPGYITTFLEQRKIDYELVCLDEGVPLSLDLADVSGLVFMGGPGNVGEPTDWMRQEMRLISEAAKRGVPMLGICLGAQLISKALGGEVYPAESLEVGWHEVERLPQENGPWWFDDLPARWEVFQWHAHTYTLPPGAVALARSKCAEQQAFALGNILALQFHLEMTPEIIRSVISRYASDLEYTSDCVQSPENIVQELETRTRNGFAIADLVFARWVSELQDE